MYIGSITTEFTAPWVINPRSKPDSLSVDFLSNLGLPIQIKKFCTRDAAGFFAAHQVGIKIMVLTGRECAATSKRMKELKVDYLFQNIKNKEKFLKEFMFENQLSKEDVGYIGDDLNDLPTMRLAGYVGCPVDSCPEIFRIAEYVSTHKGGNGAARDIVEHVLREAGE